MLKLQSIRLRNWCKTASAFIEFPERGFVFLRGINKSASDERSNGAGKTALGEAINRTLLGQSLCTALASYSRDRAGDTYIDIHATYRGQPLRVELGYRCQEFPDSKGEGLRFTLGDASPVERPQAAQTRTELTDILGVTPAVSLWTVFLDGERLKFRPPFLSQAEALSLLMQALNQPPWEKYKERAERRRDTCQEAVVAARARWQQLQSAQEDLAGDVQLAADACRAADAAWEGAQTMWQRAQQAHATKLKAVADQIAAHAATREQVKKNIREAQAADATACGKIDLELSRLGSERQTAERYLHDWTDTLATDRAALRHAEADLSQLKEGKTCHACQRPLNTAATPEQLAKEEKRVLRLQKALTESTKGKQECDACLRELDKEIAAQHQAKQQLRSGALLTLSQDLELVEGRLSSADRQLRALELQSPKPPSEDARIQAKTRWEERVRHQAAQTAALATAAQVLASAELALSRAVYWVRGFSAEGIPNLVLRQTIGPLNEAARLVSLSLSGGLVQVSFSAETELASGALKPKLVTEVNVKDGASEFLRNSKGEACLADLIIAETQTQVGRVLQRVGYRWFDEVANSLSGDARRCLYAGLKHQAREHGLLTFVVDHHSEAASAADHVLVAEKAGGLTTYRWE